MGLLAGEAADQPIAEPDQQRRGGHRQRNHQQRRGVQLRVHDAHAGCGAEQDEAELATLGEQQGRAQRRGVAQGEQAAQAVDHHALEQDQRHDQAAMSPQRSASSDRSIDMPTEMKNRPSRGL